MRWIGTLLVGICFTFVCVYVLTVFYGFYYVPEHVYQMVNVSFKAQLTKYANYEKVGNYWYHIPTPGIYLRATGYIDRRQANNSVVRLLVTRSLKKSCNSLICILDNLVVKAECLSINSNPRYKYDAAFLNCNVPKNFTFASHPSALVIEELEGANKPAQTKVAKVDLIPAPGSSRRNRHELVMCVTPTYNWNDPGRLKLFIDYYTLMGAEHFFLYNSSSKIVQAWNQPTEQLLVELVKEKKVTVVPWSALMPYTDDLGYGQILAENDCILRNVHLRTKFVALFDLDEFLVLREQKRISKNQLRRFLEDQKGPNVGALMFQSSYLHYNRSSNHSEWKAWLNSYVHPPKIRSKTIVKPETVLLQTVH